MPVVETFKLEEILNKSGGQHYPHNKSMGLFCCHGNQSLDLISPQLNAGYFLCHPRWACWIRKFVFESVEEGQATEAGPWTSLFLSIQLR